MTSDTEWRELLNQQVRVNTQSKPNRHLFAEHRAQVMRLALAAPAPAASSVCVLGAGNGNDLELGSLTQRFSRVHLVDIDADATAGYVAGSPALADRVECHLGVDLSGLVPADDADEAETPVAPLSAQARAQIARELGGPSHGVVLSTTLLTQLVDSALTAGSSPQSDLQIALGIREFHLRLMLELLRPGGTGVLICDLVSSDTWKALLSDETEVTADLMGDLVEAGNFFTGANPYAILNWMTADPVFLDQAHDYRCFAPWRWRISDRRAYLVYAISFTRKS